MFVCIKDWRKQLKLNKIKLAIVLMLGMVYGLHAQTGNLTEEQRLAFDKVFFKGMKEKMQGNLNEAAFAFKEAIILDPDNANVYYQIAEILYTQKNPNEALKYAALAVKLNAGNVWYNNLLADLYKTTRHYDKSAEQYLYMYDKIKPEVNYLYEAATCYFYMQKYSKAIKILDRIEATGQAQKEEVIIKKEQIYLQQNKIAKAIKEVERLIQLYPNVRYKGMLADLYISNKEDAKALEIYNQILAQDSTNGYASIALSEYYRSKGKVDLAYAYLKKAIASPDLDIKSKIQILVPFVTPEAGKAAKSQAYELVQIYKNAHKAEPTATMLLGDLYMQDKKYAEAREEYRKTAKLDGSNFAVWQQILYCGQELNDNKGILEDCEEALTLFPSEPLFYNFKALINVQEKNYDIAITTALQGLEYVVDNDELKVQLLSIVGDAAHYAKRPALVDSVYNEALQLQPNNAYALNNYAYFLSLRKTNLNKADSMSYLSLQLDPDNPSYLDTYGWILYQKQDYQKAKQYIEQSLKISPKSADVLEHLGDIMYKLNDKEAAMRYWQKAKENNSSGEFLDEKIKQGKLIE